MNVLDPLKTIKEYIKKGYTVRLAIESSRDGCEIKMFTQSDVKRFAVGKDVPLAKLFNAMKPI